jgi:hypothetical protein
MPWAHDVRTITRIVEVWRVGGFMTSHADGSGYFQGDVVRRIRGMLASGAVTRLTLHVLAALPASLKTGTTDVRAIDPANAAGLLPARHMAAHAIEAELLLHFDERFVRVCVSGPGPELRCLRVT